MKKLFTALAGSLLISSATFAQKGLIISEIMANPTGTNSPYEYVELLATTNINFATTPYSVVFADNGTATSNGWKAGSSVTYGFTINTGSVTAGQVVYVGGASMLPLSNGGTALRAINTGTTTGDSFGSKDTDGVLGNGGSNADGVAVFNVAASSISSSTVPVDAIFFGDAMGSAFKSSGSGYQLPVNDKYNGAKLQTSSYLAPDPATNELVKATSGTYSAATGAFTTARTWATTSTVSYNQTSITLAGANAAPTVTLAIPTVSGTAPATVSLSATATDSDGTITKVEFYNGSTLIGTVTSSPYTYSWTSVVAGTYSVTAKATDNGGAVTTSSIQTVTVALGTNQAPTVSITSPASSAAFTAPASVSIAATASDADGTISKVEFYNGSTLLGSDASSPYSYTWSSVAVGTYTITAKAYDNASAITTSSAVSINVNATNVAPTLAFNPSATYLVNETSGQVSATIGDVHDPVIVSGLDITVTDESLSTLTFAMTSSKTSVVPNANFTVTGTGNARKFKITPTAVGYSTITLKVTDNGGLNKSISFSLAVSSKYTTASAANDYYHTGFSDASAAIAIDTNFMFVADDETTLIGLYNRKSSGLPVYQFDPKPFLALTEAESDIEAAFISPTNPNRIYWFSSEGNSKKGNIKPDRDRVFATDIVGSGANATLSFVGYYKGLRSKIISWGDANGYNLSASAADGEIPKQIDGYNIEGAVIAPNGTTAYIGFRAPYVSVTARNKALICPLNNFETWFNNGSPSGNPTFGSPIELNLGTRGIRDIEKNASNQYIIVAGAFDATSNFALYSWNGQAATAPVALTANLSGLNPEAIAEIPASLNGTFRLHLISDNGSDIIYNDAVENKDLTQSNFKKYVSSYVSVSGFSSRVENDGSNMLQTNTLSKVYPNPTASIVTIELTSISEATRLVQVYTTTGLLIKETTVSITNGNATLNLSDLPTGLYLLKVEGSDKTIKLNKE